MYPVCTVRVHVHDSDYVSVYDYVHVQVHVRVQVRVHAEAVIRGAAPGCCR